MQANLNMGLMSYQIKVVVPAGRGSATPNPSITYSSSAGSSMLGIGWSFSAGAHIERGTVRGLPTYTNKDVFFAGGELVKLPKGPFYRARMEGGFVRYQWKQRDPSDQKGYWIAQYPDGSKGYFGANSQGQIQADAQVSGSRGTFRWELVTMMDRNGNRIEYSYFKDGSKAYPDQISWVFGKDGSPLYQLRFTYEDRKDHISDGKPGFDVQTKKRLKELQITSAGQRFRSYSFEYEDATGLSRLIKVTRYGRDPNKAYPVQFSMKYSDATVDPGAVKLVTMPTALGLNMGTGDADFVDINGDGLPDLIDTSKPRHVFHINQLALDKDMKQVGHDFPKALATQNPKAISAKLSNPTVQLMDYNGDGTTDLVDAVNMKIYINKGNGKWEDHSETLKSYPISTSNPNIRFFDYDGDKKIDMLFSDGTITYYWLNDGQGNWTKQAGATDIGASFDKDKLRLIDMNGDGLMDVVWITKDSLRYRKYLGYGKWSGWIKVQVDLSSVKNFPLSDKAQFSDMNGDGMADMVMLSGSKIYYMVNRNGNTFTDPIELNTGNLNIPDSSKATIRIVDINGSGSRDIVWINNNGGVTYLELFKQRPNLMKQISNGIGQRINVAYGSSVYFKLRDDTCKVGVDKACAGPWENKLPMAFTVVTQIATWASRSDEPLDQQAPTTDEKPTIQKIYYHHGFYDGGEKKFRGYRHVQTLYNGDDSVHSRKDEIKYDVGDKDTYMHGRLLERVVSNAAGEIFYKTSLQYADCPVELGGIDGKSLPFPIRFICTKASEKRVQEGLKDQSQWKLLRSEHRYDGFGNLIYSKNFGEKDKSGDEQITRRSFITPRDPNEAGSSWNVRAVQKAERCAKDAGPCATIMYYYDGEAFKGLPLGQLTKGNLTRTAVKASLTEDKWVEPQRRKFDEWGNVVEILGPTGHRRKVEWDPQYQKFATKETVYNGALTYAASTVWDYANNVVKRSTDYNGKSTRYTYDVFGRMLAMYLPGDVDGKPSAQYVYEMRAPLSRILTRKRSVKGGSELDRTYIQCFDGLGRKLQQRTLLDDGKYLVTNHKLYNVRGATARIWRAYHGGEACSFTPPQGQRGLTTFHYDALGRMVSKRFSDGSFTKQLYRPLVVESHDEEDTDPTSAHFNTPQIAIQDGLGRTVQEIKTLASGKRLVTRYAYSNVNAKMTSLVTSTTYPDGKRKLHEYDLLGYLIRTVDPDRSTLSYRYNAGGNLLEKTDARGVISTFSYDLLGRLVAHQQKGKPETRTTYVYDVATKAFPEARNLKARLAAVLYPGGAMYSSYSDQGENVLTRHVLMGVNFDIKREFNNVGELTSLTYPDGRVLRFTHTKDGRWATVPGFVKSNAYATTGTLQSRTLENGVKVAYRYDDRLRISGIDVASQPGFGYALSHDRVGNITATQETYGSQKIDNSYSYDSLYRLTQASLGGPRPEVLDFTLDGQHNILSKRSSLQGQSPVHIGEFKYDPTRIHAATQAGALQMKYDAAGYMSARGSARLTWDYLGRLREVRAGDAVTGRYWYDGSVSRTIKEERGVHSFYPFKDLRIQGGYVSIYLMQGGHHIAEWRSTKMLAQFYDDIGGGEADGVINSADAWAYHAHRAGIQTAAVKERPIDMDLTRSMLQASAYRLLTDGKDEKYFIHTDHLGSVRMVTDAQGNAIAYKRYYPYGAVQAAEGSLQTLGFQGTVRDRATRWNYFGARYLDPRLGKWLSPDPAFERFRSTADEWNSYASVSNNPLRFRDRDGYMSEEATQWTSVGSTGGIALLSLTAAAVTTAFQWKHHGKLGKRINYGQRAMIGLAVASAALHGAAASLRATGDENTSAILQLAGGGINFIKGLAGTYVALKKYSFISQNSQVKISKKMRIGRALSGVTMALSNGGSMALSRFGDESQTSVALMTIATAGSMASMFINVALDRRAGRMMGRALFNKSHQPGNVVQTKDAHMRTFDRKSSLSASRKASQVELVHQPSMSRTASRKSTSRRRSTK